MNYTLFFAIINLILISRLCFTMRDEGISGQKDILWLTIIPLLILPLLNLNLSWVLLAVYLLLIRPAAILFLEKNKNKLNQKRLLALFAHILVIGFLASPLFDLKVADWVSAAENGFVDLFFTGEPFLHWQYFHAVLFGFLMALNESNIAIRTILEKLDLTPLSNDYHEIDKKQFRTGRVIGFLERIFVFLFILLNQYTAIGFIIAAKGVVRYPDFGKKSFNEYILIGTLLSVLFAMLFAFITTLLSVHFLS